MNKKSLCMLFAGFMLVITLNVQAEDSLYIYTANSGKTSLILDEIKYLTFDATSMTINKINGVTSSVDFADLKFFSLNNYDVTTSELSYFDEDVICVFPNPVINELIVDKLQNASQVVLLNLQGRKLIDIHTQKNEVKVPMHSYPSGIYFIQISDENGVYVKKIIKN